MTFLLDFIRTLMCSWLGLCPDGACRVVEHANQQHIVCSYQVGDISAGVFLNDVNNKPFARMGALEKSLTSKPVLLMNGGMYHSDLAAVGLYVEKGIERQKLSTKGGWGNFHLLPNGVFWGKNGKLHVTETLEYKRNAPKPDFATQSGPMLVIEGKLHPRFLKDSDSLKIRNGVGISKDGKTIHFAISKGSVTFWNFGELFQKELKAHNALFLDGSVSAIRTKDFSQGGWRVLGPIIGVFENE